MRRKTAKAISTMLFVTMLSGCAGNVPAQMGGMVQNQTVGEDAKGAAQNFGEGAGIQGTGEGDGGTAGEPSGGQQSSANGGADVYYMDEIYTAEENILPITESAAAWGISYRIENVEYTESLGDRKQERLKIYNPRVNVDSQGKLSGDYKYLFLTITFTNTADTTQEIVRSANEITVIGTALNTVNWASDSCYYDVDWEKGTESQKHHWILEPGESVTSEVGWLIEGCSSMLEADDTLEQRMGSGGPYELYYHVKQYDGNNEGSYFIDLGVKVE